MRRPFYFGEKGRNAVTVSGERTILVIEQFADRTAESRYQLALEKENQRCDQKDAKRNSNDDAHDVGHVHIASALPQNGDCRTVRQSPYFFLCFKFPEK
jgi:hypothetical protein